MGVKSLNNSTEEIVYRLKSLPAFSDLPDLILEKFAQISEFQSFSHGSTILTQDQENHYLYFLLDGKLTVKVDDEIVTHLEDLGDIIGEMSIISNKTASATVITEGECEILAINTENLGHLTEKEITDFQHVLYRVFAIILTNKLAITNKKAKDFEITNRYLMVAQRELEAINESLEKKVRDRTADIEKRNIELLANQGRLEKLTAIKNAALKNMEKITDKTIPKLKETLKKLTKHGDKSVKKLIADSESELISLNDAISPIMTAYQSEQALADKNILILEQNPKEQLLTKMALGGAGTNLDIAADEESFQKIIKQIDFDVVCVGIELVSLIPEIIKKNPNAKAIFLSSEDLYTNLKVLNQYPSISNVVTFDKEDRSLTIKNIATTVNKIINKDIFGIEKYLNWGAEIREIKITGSIQRQAALTEMKGYFANIGIRNNVIKKASAISEELLMNSIYDAPVDEKGKPKYNHLSRTNKVFLLPHEQGKLRFASDGLFLAISVEDPFGSLEKDTIIEYLTNCYVDQPGTLHSKRVDKGGAGLGLFQMISSSSFVIFNIKKNSKTEVIALFELDPKKARQKGTPSFHYFSE